jgi:hypothetical protein
LFRRWHEKCCGLRDYILNVNIKSKIFSFDDVILRDDEALFQPAIEKPHVSMSTKKELQSLTGKPQSFWSKRINNVPPRYTLIDTVIPDYYQRT